MRCDIADGLDRAPGRSLDRRDLAGDIGGRLGGLLRQRLRFGADHRKAATGLAGSRRLDRDIERQQIGLRGDRLDQSDHRPDPLAHRRQPFNLID
nr:hypothetical protein [Rhodopseudomonas palustris]